MNYDSATRPGLIALTVALFLSLSFNLTAIMSQLLKSDTLKGIYSLRNNETPERLPFVLSPAIMIPQNLPEEEYGLDATKWDAIMPGNRGIVTLNNSTHYQVSVFHQLECLMSFREYFAQILESDDPSSVALAATEYDTVEHCTSYLTQMILCAGDLALEPSAEGAYSTNGRRVHLVHPFGVVHKCKDWRPVREWLNEHDQL